MQGANNKAADCSFVVVGRPDMSCPNLVVETANGQTLDSLHAKVEAYFLRTECIQAILCFKLYDDQTMVAFLFLKPSARPVRIVSFGPTMLSGDKIEHIRKLMHLNDPGGLELFSGYTLPLAVQCLNPSIPDYLITIPRAYLLSHNADRSVLSNLPGGDLVVDLFLVRQSTLVVWDL